MKNILTPGCSTNVVIIVVYEWVVLLYMMKAASVCGTNLFIAEMLQWLESIKCKE